MFHAHPPGQEQIAAAGAPLAAVTASAAVAGVGGQFGVGANSDTDENEIDCARDGLAGPQRTLPRRSRRSKRLRQLINTGLREATAVVEQQ
jgi:hypothetical protein